MAIRVTKAWLENRAKAGKNVGFTQKGIKKYMWACGSTEGRCSGSHNSKIQQVVHGSKDGAWRCIRARG